MYGTRDATADWAPVVEAARARRRAGGPDAPPTAVVEWAADHFFVGQAGDVTATVADFLVAHADAG